MFDRVQGVAVKWSDGGGTRIGPANQECCGNCVGYDDRERPDWPSFRILVSGKGRVAIAERVRPFFVTEIPVVQRSGLRFQWPRAQDESYERATAT